MGSDLEGGQGQGPRALTLSGVKVKGSDLEGGQGQGPKDLTLRGAKVKGSDLEEGPMGHSHVQKYVFSCSSCCLGTNITLHNQIWVFCLFSFQEAPAHGQEVWERQCFRVVVFLCVF